MHQVNGDWENQRRSRPIAMIVFNRVFLRVKEVTSGALVNFMEGDKDAVYLACKVSKHMFAGV